MFQGKMRHQTRLTVRHPPSHQLQFTVRHARIWGRKMANANEAVLQYYFSHASTKVGAATRDLDRITRAV